ncbi:hypothetical protein [Dyadobacter sediminis]|uniref:Cytochrome C n=1 Tax=Dyadobacter sediminis TaxID=1493691 RepID=A0A5R9KD91_9BACT|nr:hypothetical protein [Dyadobacter sediminis]TLU94102.1 hypothetical protein FEM55_07515 [Dyadobacter sediminis]GGB94228.1 hypothetical protein GCM10011325_22060 [Dyadobacter sediminis]
MVKIVVMLFAGLSLAAQIFKESDRLPKPESAAIMTMDTVKKDSETGLITDQNLYMVKAQCTSCHSSKLILQNRFTRDGWKQKIRWMQANHNLWDLGETEKEVLDYLEKHYAPEVTAARREPLKNIKWYKLEEKR